MVDINHSNNSIRNNKCETIIDGSSVTQHEADPKRFSRSLNNLNVNPQLLNAIDDTRHECISLHHLAPPPQHTMTMFDQTPLWTALTITAQISYAEEDS
jgi:hypothetical protein